jgi:membrane-associated phospholipid phosphatase
MHHHSTNSTADARLNTGRSSNHSQFRWIWGPILLVAAAVVFPFDGWIARSVESLEDGLPGDVVRELEALQQFGQGAWIVLVAAALVSLQPWRARRLLDLAAAALMTSLIGLGLKMLIGRPRPTFDEPLVLLGPFRRYVVSEEAGLRHAWELWAPISSDLWSMPSSHTASAMAVGAFVARMQPRLTLLMVVLVSIVAIARVLLGAHYPSDVLVGASVGWMVGGSITHVSGGVRGIDWVWKRCINRNATPALPRLIEAERQHGIDI